MADESVSFVAQLATGCYVAIWGVGLWLERSKAEGDRKIGAKFVGLASFALGCHATVAMLTRVQTDPNPIWNLGALVAGALTTLTWRRHFEEISDREERCMEQLFGRQTLRQLLTRRTWENTNLLEPTIWELLLTDKRLKTWRLKT